MLDTIIRGGTIIDGTGRAAFTGDVGVRDGHIVSVGGSIDQPCREEIDARGALVTPAWIDIHTHYDGQVAWDEEMLPSAGQGVGTIVMGNCGVGFAPVLPGGERDLIYLMEGVEDIPGTALHEAIPWGAWESYPQYLDYLASRRYAIDISSMITHGAVRNYVMGGLERANSAPTLDEIERMAQIVEQALRAGAVGFSTGRVTGHRSIDGQSVPGTFAQEAELTAISNGMKRAGSGVLQAILAGSFNWAADEPPIVQEAELIGRLSAASGLRATYTLAQKMDAGDEWRDVLAMTKAWNEKGAKVFPQVGSRPTGFVFSLDTYHPFMARPTYLAIQHLPVAERAAEMRKPEVKQRILSESDVQAEFPGKMASLIPTLPLEMIHTFPLNVDSDYEPDRGLSFGAAIEKDGGRQTGHAYLYDYLAADGGERFAISFFGNYAHYNLDDIREMQLDESTVIGLSDAGAHVSAILDAVSPTYQLTFWCRDRKRGERLPIEQVVRKQTALNAELFGFHDRGRLAPGLRADINVIDFDKLKLGAMEVRRDLPFGGARLMQAARGYIATLIRGEVIRRNDQDTGARPGRLVRGSAA